MPSALSPKIDDEIPTGLRAALQGLARTGRIDEAARWLAQAIEGGGLGVGARLELMRMHLRRRDLAAAEAALKAALAAAPGDLRGEAAQRELGLALFSANFWEDAAPWLAKAMSLYPWDRGLAKAHARARRPDYLGPDPTDPTTGKKLSRYAAREGAAYIYVVDVVGTCNLRCPTCPVGNSPNSGRSIGFMPYDLFERIVRKMRAESPSPRPIVNLYNWGEPLLHPELPRMIGLLKASDMRAQLSSNLNVKRGLEEAIAAGPDELKISLSGFSDETYSRTHRRGKLDLVKNNMRRVRDYLDKHKGSTHVWVGHHLYRSNAAEAPLVRAFCEELGFSYNPIPAFYMPLERLIEHIDGKPNPADAGIVDDLMRAPAELAREAGKWKSGNADCELRFNQTVINHDGKVALCCTVYDQENMLGVDFLNEDFAALERRKYAHSFCAECYRRKLEYAPPELARMGN